MKRRTNGPYSEDSCIPIYDIRDLKQLRRLRQQQRQKTIDQDNSSARASRFLVHFFNIDCTTKTWNVPMRRYTEDVDIRRQISFLYFNMDKVLKNSTPGKGAYIWRIKRFQIEVSKDANSFLSDVFTAVVVVVA